jgi:hypothetical protein
MSVFGSSAADPVVIAAVVLLVVVLGFARALFRGV